MIKQLLIIDSKIDYFNEILIGLKGVSNDLDSIGLGIENDFEFSGMAGLQWQVSTYDKDYLIVTPQWLRINSVDRGDYDVITFVIDDSNWNKELKNNSVWGWSVGRYGKYRILLVRAKKGRTSFSVLYGKKISVYFALLEELFHTLQWFIQERTGVNLNTKYGFDVSEKIIHGSHPSYTRWKYKKFLKENKDLLLKAFEIMPKYIIIGNDQYLVIESLKIAISIADGVELAKLVKNGLTGVVEPQGASYLEGYIVYPGIEIERLKDILNI